MYLNQLNLENFRCYGHRQLSFTSATNLIIGSNGSGKTNILEAIYFLSSGKSFRAPALSQLIYWGKPYSIVSGQLTESHQHINLEAQLIKNPPPSTSLSRQFLVENIKKPRSKYLGALKTVIFEPEDIRLITGSPSRRRDYLDSIFATTEWRYAQSLSQYHRALKHRNELLDLIRQNQATKAELFYWDQSLVKNADIIEEYRSSFVRSVNGYFTRHPHSEIQKFSLNYQPSVVTLDKLERNFAQELAQGYTSCGLHRDDFSLNSTIFPTSDQNLAFWGSRGQQRLAVLALRLAQINYLEETYHQSPILLLDDIFSELDPEHRYLVVEICGKYQTIFTSAESNTSDILPGASIINLLTAQI